MKHLFPRTKALTVLLTALVVAGMVLGAAAFLAPSVSAANTGNAVTTFQGASVLLHARSGPFATSNSSPHAAGVQQSPRLAPLPFMHPKTHARPLANAQSVMPQADALNMDSGMARRGAGRVLNNDKGLDSVDSFNTNGFLLEPPDEGLCVGNLNLGNGVQKVLWPIVNDTVEITAPNGTRLAGPLNLNQFFGEPAAEAMSDPRCAFDTVSQSWFFLVLAIDPNGDTHTDLLAISVSFSTNEVQLDTTEATNAAGGCPCFGDQPKLGFDRFNVYTTDDQFSNTTGNETGDTLFAVSKADLVNHAAMVHSNEFMNLALAGIPVLSLEPAINMDRTRNEPLLNSFPFDASGNNTELEASLGLWSFNDADDVEAGKVATLTATVIASPTYAFPVPAMTTNGLALAANSNDDRMQQVEFVNGNLFGALDSAVAFGGDPVTRDGAAWFEIHTDANARGNHLSGHVIDHGVVGVRGAFILNPAIVVTTRWTIGLGFSVTSPTLNPSSAFAVRAAGSRRFGSVHITALGAGPDIGFTCQGAFVGTGQECRWGDYSWSTLDPNGRDMWMASENTVSDVATQSAGVQTNWGNQMWEVSGSDD